MQVFRLTSFPKRLNICNRLDFSTIRFFVSVFFPLFFFVIHSHFCYLLGLLLDGALTCQHFGCLIYFDGCHELLPFPSAETG